MLAVVFYHSGVRGFGGGYVGVDVFFVISGCLITQLLLLEIDGSGLDSVDFYARRVRRLLPAGLVAVLATVAIQAWRASPEELGGLFADGVSAATYTSNLHFIATAFAYFDAGVEHDPLTHTWSLGVEAQFYLVWPLLVAVLAGRRTALAASFALLMAASFAASVLLTRSNLPLAFYGLPTRLWELAAGALLALPHRPLPPRLGQGLAIAGLAAIGLAVVWLDRTTPFPGWIAALPVGGAAAVVLGGGPPGVANRLLTWPPLQAIGQLSYSWYLWHWPLLTLLHRFAPGAGLVWRLAVVLAALGVAVVSYRLVELPVRRSRWLARRPVLTLGLGLGATALGVAVMWLLTRSG